MSTEFKTNQSGFDAANSGAQYEYRYIIKNGVPTQIRILKHDYNLSTDLKRQNMKAHGSTHKGALLNSTSSNAIIASQAFDSAQDNNTVFLPSNDRKMRHNVSLEDAATVFGLSTGALLAGLETKNHEYTFENFCDGCAKFEHIEIPAINTARLTTLSAFSWAASNTSQWVRTNEFSTLHADNDRHAEHNDHSSPDLKDVA